MKKIKFNQNINLNIFNTTEKMENHLVDLFIKEFNKGLCLVSGGNTPKNIYKKITNSNHVKSQRKLLLADDRLVSETSELSNYNLLKKFLKIDFSKNYPISYFKEINLFGSQKLEKKISLILKKNKLHCSFLGIGSDGHTASLFPFNKTLNSKKNSFKLQNRFDNFSRYSLSYNSIMMSEKIIFIVTGIKKNEALRTFFNGKINFDKYPFQKIAINHSLVEFYGDTLAFKDII